MKPKKSIAIIGGGASALMLACSLDSDKYDVSVYEKNAALGRKFLVAGKGGFNLTHSENIEQFAERYYPENFIKPFLEHFSNTDFRKWLKSIGIDTYVGTSKRVFPIKGIKPIEVLNAIEDVIKKNNGSLYYNYEWKGWDNDQLIFQTSDKHTLNIKTDIVVFALGGASWKVTGSAGDWTAYFEKKGIQTHPFYPSNCAYKVTWKEGLISKTEGQALKNCEFSCGHLKRKGEAVITRFGIEGSGIYPLSHEIRNQLWRNRHAKLIIDFKPELSLQEIQTRLENRGKISVKDVLDKKINLSKTQLELLKYISSKEEYNDTLVLSRLIKSYPVDIIDFAPLDDAISTVGGVALNEVNENLELKKLPDYYCMGEMLDWDAPTGGYLLQACFSMGKFLADKLNETL